MYPSLQMTFNLTNKEQLKRTWAFAKDQSSYAHSRALRTISDYKNCVITSCSREAKALGVRAGMKYEEAKLLIPELRIIVIGSRQLSKS